MLYCILHVCCALELAIDRYCLHVFNVQVASNSIAQWNVMQALLRRAALCVEGGFVAAGAEWDRLWGLGSGVGGRREPRATPGPPIPAQNPNADFGASSSAKFTREAPRWGDFERGPACSQIEAAQHFAAYSGPPGGLAQRVVGICGFRLARLANLGGRSKLGCAQPSPGWVRLAVCGGTEM